MVAEPDRIVLPFLLVHLRAGPDRRAAGVGPADSGVASGLIDTSQQIGGAIGVAVATTIATTASSHYAGSADAALTHGFRAAFWVAAAAAALAVVVTGPMAESEPEAGSEYRESHACADRA